MTRKRCESAGTCLNQPQRPKPIPGISKRGNPSPWISYSMLEPSVMIVVGTKRSLPCLLVLPRALWVTRGRLGEGVTTAVSWVGTIRKAFGRGVGSCQMTELVVLSRYKILRDRSADFRRKRWFPEGRTGEGLEEGGRHGFSYGHRISSPAVIALPSSCTHATAPNDSTPSIHSPTSSISFRIHPLYLGCPISIMICILRRAS